MSQRANYHHYPNKLLPNTDVLLRGYPRTEQKATACVEQYMEVTANSLHGGLYALQLVWSFCANARENVATLRGVVAQVWAQSEGRTAACESAGRCQRYLLSVANGLPVESLAAAVWLTKYGPSLLSGMEPTTRLPSLLEEVSNNV